MTILVPIKRVVDPYAKVRPNASQTAIETTGVKFDVNPFDEIACEEAVRIREKHPDTQIVAVSIGTGECEEQLRKALAMGADRAILLETSDPLDSPAVADQLASLVQEIKPDLVLMGKQATDDDCNQAGQMLAAKLGWPQATFASKIEIEGSRARVARETDTGSETLEFDLPGVVTADLRLNEPRYIALPGIIKARSKPLEKRPITPAAPLTRTVSVVSAPQRQAGIKVGSVDELFEQLKTRGAI